MSNDTVTMRVDGLSDVLATLRRIGKDAEKEVSRAVVATALEVNTDVKKRILRGPKTGKIYTRGKGKNLSRSHRASAPGEAPATDTGALASSIYFRQTAPAQATIGSTLAYAYYLEYGTTRIQPRPAWVPATVAGQAKMMKRLRKAMGEVVQ